MFAKLPVVLSLLSLLSVTSARYQWLERDGRYVALYPRRFGQEHPAVIDKLSAACPGQVCGVLAGAAITPLLAAQPECSQQDMADQIIDAAQQFDEATKQNMIALAIEYRQAEKNTPPDFSTNPPTPRNSVFCQKAPKNAELNGLVQAQDPANGDIFFDPATKASVKRGDQPNTFPFGTSGSAGSGSGSAAATTSAAATGSTIATTSATAAGTATAAPAAGAASTTAAPAATPTVDASAIGNFGKCSVPQIEFGVGFDNRRETSFQPVDKQSFNHGSAQAIGIIAQFICDTLTNSCGADATAKATCAKAQAAVNGAAAKTGGQADLFNAAFGIKTDFAAIASVDDQGRIVAGTGSANAAAGSTNNTAATGSGIGNFGKCTVPQIEFGVGFDNRKETSFQPVDKQSFNHGSAQAIGIIAQFICDTLTNSCGADATAKATCAQAQTAVNGAAAKTGGQADLFNAAFGIKTNFAAIASVDDQGRVVAGTGSGASSSDSTGSATTTAAGAANTAAASAGGIGNFGKCTVPQIEFGTGFDGRKETSFQPVDKQSYNHGSAQNGGIITQFICDTLVNSCGADATARATCATAKTAFDSKPAKTGAQADAFNAVFGISTNFAAVPAVDNQGKVVSA